MDQNVTMRHKFKIRITGGQYLKLRDIEIEGHSPVSGMLVSPWCLEERALVFGPCNHDLISL